MNKYFLFVFVVTFMVAYFFWGVGQSNKAERADCEKEIIVKEVEVIKYVTKEKVGIYSKPNANRDTLLKLYSEGKL